MTAICCEQSVDALVPGHEAALAALADAATAANGETAVTEDTGAAFTADDTEFNVFNTDRKLAAIEAICEVLDGIPGKKSLIQFTGGITQTGEENRSELIAATNSANRSNVSIYSVDSRGLLTATPGGDASVGASGGTAMFTGATVISQSQSRAGFARHAGDARGRHRRALLLRCRRFRQSFSERAERHFRLLPGGLLQHGCGARRQLAARPREDQLAACRRARSRARRILRGQGFRHFHDGRPRAATRRGVPLGNSGSRVAASPSKPRSSGSTRIRFSFPSPRSSRPARCSGRKSAAATRPLSILPPRCATPNPTAWSARCATPSP